VNKEDIEKYLRMLGHELQQRQVTGEILLAGGAVMLLVVQNREVTKDIDAYFLPEQAEIIREAARVIADREGLAYDWLNDGVKGFFYTQPPTQKWAEFPGLRVYVTSLDYLFAMKVVAGRPQDIEDIKALVPQLNIANAQEALAIVKKYVPEQLLVPRIEYVIEEIFE
jgi:predicted nucleotidyltransferase